MILVGQKRPVLDFEDHLLSTGWWLRHPSENMSSSVGVTIPNIWEIKNIKTMFQTTNRFQVSVRDYIILYIRNSAMGTFTPIQYDTKLPHRLCQFRQSNGTQITDFW